MEYLVIGVDCAVNPADVGLARVRGHTGHWNLETVVRASTMRRPEQIVAEWIHEENGAILLALDAPLGWPAPMSVALSEHRAGGPIDATAHELFRRNTDLFIAKTFRKTPLDVGADRIARTAHWTVNFLERLRQRLDTTIPLAWGLPLTDRISAIEVYPAATLLAHGADLAGYKSPRRTSERVELYALLGRQFTCSPDCASAVSSPHTIDAAICALAGADFLEGRAVAPEDRTLAEREGWIWARTRD